MSSKVVAAWERDNAELLEETLQLRRENETLRGELTQLRRVRRQWAKDFATIEAQVREGQRFLEEHAREVHPPSLKNAAAISASNGSIASPAEAVASPAVSSASPLFTDSEKDQLIETLAHTCETLRQELRAARAATNSRMETPQATAQPEAVLDDQYQAGLEGLLVENMRLRDALARFQTQHVPSYSQPQPVPESASPHNAIDVASSHADVPHAQQLTDTADVPDSDGHTEKGSEGNRRHLEAAEREVLALSIQNEELLRDVRHFTRLASTRLVSTAENAAQVAALPAAENAMRLLEQKSRAEAHLTASLRRLEAERDGLREALDRALALSASAAPQTKESTVPSVPYLDLVEAEAEDILQQLVEFCGVVADVEGDGPLAEVWSRATKHATVPQPPLLPSLPDPQYVNTPVHHLIGVLRGIGYVARQYMTQLRPTHAYK